MKSERVTIIKIITLVLQQGKTLEEALMQYGATEEPFIKAHCYGVCRWYFQLDAIAKQLLGRPLKEKDKDIYVLILLGLHQIFHSHAKDYALVSETVETAQLLKKPWAKGLINACLRRALREKAELATQHHEAHPAWMIDQFKKNWPRDSENILAANNQQAPMTLRVNVKRLGDIPSLADFLQNTSENIKRDGACVYLKTPIAVHALPGFKEGIVSVQDESSQYAAPLLQLAPKERVLDACAAPGGKTGHLLELQKDIDLTVVDLKAERLEKVKENLQRINIKANIQFHIADASEFIWPEHHFDKILLDAPCSGTGVIRRHPDIKLLRRESDIASFALQQKKLLTSLWKALKIKGLLLYTTCSIMKEENEDLIEAFLSTHPDAKTEAISLPIGKPVHYGWQCLPTLTEHDGFYYCLLEKQG